jgi:uncharacterized membrane protein YccC
MGRAARFIGLAIAFAVAFVWSIVRAIRNRKRR